MRGARLHICLGVTFLDVCGVAVVKEACLVKSHSPAKLASQTDTAMYRQISVFKMDGPRRWLLFTSTRNSDGCVKNDTFLLLLLLKNAVMWKILT